MKRALIGLVFAAGLASAQNISVGFRVGVPLTDAFKTIQTAGTIVRNRPSHWIAGPTLEIRLPAGLGITFDALNNRLGYESAGQTQSGLLWEFPAMLRYRIGAQPLVKPFLAAGGSFNKLTGIRTPKSSVTGIVFGGGVEIKLPFMRLAPELRLSRRLEENVTLGSIQSNLNQAVFLVGLTF